jgi:hypothetical protein
METKSVVTLYYMATGVTSGWIGDRSKKLFRHTMELERIAERMAAAIEMMDANIDANQKNMNINQERMEAKTEAKNKMLRSFDVFFFSRMDIHQARTGGVQEKIIPKLDANQERMTASVNAWRK